MSFLPEHFSLAAPGAAGMKHDFLGSGPLLTGAVVLGSHSPLLPMLGPHSSPTNSSQSDTATTADAQLSLGSAGAAADVATGPKGSSAGKKGGMSAHSHASTLAAGNAHAGHMHGQHSQHSSQVGYDPKREWLYRLVTFPHYFTPCVSCCNGSNTPKREQLMTLFDTRAPHRVFCCHCPTPKGSTGHFSASHGRDGALLQVRRSSFKNAVNANDICRFGADLGGVQQYTLNGNKIIYLAREASAKKTGHGAPPPASCTVDGRAMMDKNSLYCSLMCKMQAEDPGFTNWLDCQDPSVRIMAQISANAPPVPTVACKRNYYASARESSASPKSSNSSGASGGSDGSMGTKDIPGNSGLSAAALPPLAGILPAGLVSGAAPVAAGASSAPAAGGAMGAAGIINAGVFSSAVSRTYQSPQSNRPTKVARLTARSNSAPLTFAAAAGSNAFGSGSNGGGFGGSSGNEALLLGMAASGGRTGSGALLEGLTSRPVARQLLPNGPNAAAVEAAARQAAVAAAAAAFSGAGTSAAAAAARDALGAAGLAPIRTGNGSPVYSSITQAQRQQQQQQQQTAAGAAAGQKQQQQQPAAKKQVSAFAAAANSSGSNAGDFKQLAPQTAGRAAAAAAGPRPESPKAPGLGGATFGPLVSSISLPEPFLPGAEVPSSMPAMGTGLPGGFEGVGGLLDMGFNSMGAQGALGDAGNPAWGSVGDIAGLLGVSDSHSPMHPGLDGFDAFFGDGSLSPAPQMMF